MKFSFPGGSEVKVSACNIGDLGSIPGSGRSPGEGHGNPLQYSCLENPMDEEPGRGVAKSWTWLSDCGLWGLVLFSLGIVLWWFIQVVECIQICSFLQLNGIPWRGYSTVCLAIYLVKDNLGYFQFGTITNKSAVNVHAEIFVWTQIFISLGWMPKTTIAGVVWQLHF